MNEKFENIMKDYEENIKKDYESKMNIHISDYEENDDEMLISVVMDKDQNIRF